MIIHVLSLLVAVFAAQKPCTTKHSTFYNNNHTDNKSFFVPETLVGTGKLHPCQVISYTQFNNDIKNYQRSGWTVDHIIDLQNSDPELADCQKHIRGNMILVNSQWAQDMKKLCWDNAKIEKKEIYGAIFNKAIENIRMCCKPKSQQIPYQYIIPGIVIGVVLILLLIIVVVFYIKSKNTNTPMTFDTL